jgi:hypothetical protein
MRKFVSNEELYYQDYKKKMQFFWDMGIKHGNGFKDSKILENSYLHYYVDDQSDEHDRLCVLLPLIKIEIENNMLSKELLEELEIYYADFNDGILDDELYEHEYEEIKSDLYWCYENKN